MDIFGISGWSGSGKTTLIRALIPVLAARGFVVGTLKNSHHGLSLAPQVEVPGAVENLIAGPERFAMLGGWDENLPDKLPVLASHLRGVELLLVEGFKYYHHPRLEVWNSALGKPMLVQTDHRIIALVSDGERPDALDLRVHWFHRDDLHGIAGFIQKARLSLDGVRG